MRISMMSPMPFWPSLPPWKKLTPVQVRISKPRIHSGGGLLPSGSLYSAGILIVALSMVSSRNARAEADQRRDQQGLADLGGLAPIDAAGAGGARRHQLIHEADADDGADQRMRTR